MNEGQALNEKIYALLPPCGSPDFLGDLGETVRVCMEKRLALEVFPDGGVAISSTNLIGGQYWETCDPQWSSWDGESPEENAAIALLKALGGTP